MRFSVPALVVAASMCSAACAQVGQRGAVSGTVVAPDGAAIAGARVVLSQPDGFVRESTSAPDGSFSFPDLASGTYLLHAAAPGFAATGDQTIIAATGRVTSVALHMRLAGASEKVTVTAEANALDMAQTSSVVNVDRDRIEEQPIPSRNYLSFVALSPQATPANPAIASQSLTPGSGEGFGFGGLRPGSNSVHIDGVDDDDEYTGGSRTELSPEAINDFQIVNHGFAAQSGGGAGGSIDVQTREGANRRHGDAFVFVQNGAVNATPPLERVARKPDAVRVRAGLSQGGALRTDHSFYYVAAEQEMFHGEDANDLAPSTINSINTALQAPGPLHGLSLESGYFPTTGSETEISGRLDQVLRPSESLMLRFAFSNFRHVNDAFHTNDLADRTARGSSFLADNGLNGTLASTLSSSTANRLSFAFAQRRALEKTGDDITPGASIAGVAEFGTPFDGNSRRFETHVGASDMLLRQEGHHLFGLGAEAEDVRLRSAVQDGARGLFVFRDLASFTQGTPDVFVRSTLPQPNRNFSEQRISGFAQDHWAALPRLSVDAGLRYDVNLLPSPIPRDLVNFAPRVGLAWSPLSTLVVRSGFGVFYDRYLLSTINRVLEFHGAPNFWQVAEGADAAAAYAGTVAQTATLAAAPSIWTAQPGLRNPYSEVASLSVEKQLPLGTTLKAEYQFVHGVHLGRTANANLLPPVLLTTANAASLGIANPSPQQIGRQIFPLTRRDTAYDAISQFQTTAGSRYNGGTITLNRQFTDNFEMLAGYTYSKTVDDASYDFEQPQNPFHAAAERALSLNDQRHRLSVNALWLIGPDTDDPADAAKNANPGPLMKALTGLEFAPVLSIGSGFRADPLVGTDANAEHIFPFAARPLGYGRNSLSTPANIQFDMRVLRVVPLGPGHLDVVAESFNLLNHRNTILLNNVYGTGAAPQPGFGLPIEAAPARVVQFSLDYEY